MSIFNKSSIGPVILNYEKSVNEELSEKFYEVDEVALVIKLDTKEEMVAFTVKELPEKYFWASTGLKNFISDNIDVATFDEERNTYKFDEPFFTKYCGKKVLKSDKNKSCNIWKINF